MTVTDFRTDPAQLTMTITAEYDAPVERVWRLWADPRKLERWWGPPGYPATFVDHDLSPGGAATYFMTSPEGERYHGWWRVLAVEAPGLLEVEDGFADGEGRPNHDLPVTRMTVTLTERTDGATTMTMSSTYPSLEAMEQVIAMGVDEGIKAALGQTDAILAEA